MAGPFQGNLRWRRPGPGKAAHGLDHPRAGELVLVAEPDAWFTYYWLDDARAPDFARWWRSTASPGTTRLSSSSTLPLAGLRVRVSRFGLNLVWSLPWCP